MRREGWERRKGLGVRGELEEWGEFEATGYMGGKLTPFTPTLPNLPPPNSTLPGLRAFSSFLLHPKPSCILGMGRGAQWE